MALCQRALDVRQLQRPVHSVTVVFQMISALMLIATAEMENGEDVQGATVCPSCVPSARSAELDCVFHVRAIPYTVNILSVAKCHFYQTLQHGGNLMNITSFAVVDCVVSCLSPFSKCVTLRA